METVDISAQPLDISFHPTSNLLLSPTLSGNVICIDAEHKSISFEQEIFEESCRSSIWHCTQTSGGYISAGMDRSWVYIDSNLGGQEISRKQDAHEFPISRLQHLHENLFVSADDEGVIKIWDSRSCKEVRTYHENEDYISDFAYSPDTKTLIAAGGDGYLTVLDIRKKELLARSDNFEVDLLSVSVIKGGKKVAVGMDDGVLGIFNWGDWGDVKDRILGHPLSVDCIAKYDEDTIFTGSSDGMIRVLDIYPTNFTGVLGDQGDFPIERISLSSSRKYLGSISHDDTVRIWNMDELIGDDTNGDEDVQAEKDDEKDVENEEEEEDDREKEEEEKENVSDQADSCSTASSDSDEEQPAPPKKKQKQFFNQKANNQKTSEDSFFSGLVSDDES